MIKGYDHSDTFIFKQSVYGYEGHLCCNVNSYITYLIAVLVSIISQKFLVTTD